MAEDTIPPKGAVDDVIEASVAAAFLARSRQILFRSWLRDARDIRGALNSTARDAAELLRERAAEVAVSPIPPTITNGVHREITQMIESVFQDVDYTIRGSVQSSIERAIRLQMQHLRSRGVGALTDSELISIARDTFLKLRQEFPPGSGISYLERISAIKNKHIQQMKKVLNVDHGEDVVDKVAREIQVGLSYTKSSRTPLQGGSASKELQRLLLSEESRLANIAEVAVMKASGIPMVYWRLNPAHRDYGGHEICEVLASQTGEGVKSSLFTSDGSFSGVSLEGLYTIDEYPDYPHPFCMCYPEPLILGNK